MDVFLKNQLKIARDTMRMSDAGAFILGGMTKDEARALLKKHQQRKPGKSRG